MSRCAWQARWTDPSLSVTAQPERALCARGVREQQSVLGEESPYLSHLMAGQAPEVPEPAALRLASYRSVGWSFVVGTLMQLDRL